MTSGPAHKIPVECVLHASQLYVIWSPDVSTIGVGPQVNKFEKVSCDDHQLLLAGVGLGPGVGVSHV